MVTGLTGGGKTGYRRCQTPAQRDSRFYCRAIEREKRGDRRVGRAGGSRRKRDTSSFRFEG